VVILDCCFSGAFGDLLAKDDGSVDLESQLGTEGGVVLTSSSSLQYSFEQQGSDLSIYTRYLVEGIRTGAADRDGDGAVSVDELHHFASKKVQAAAPAMTPKIIVLKDEGFRIRLAKAPIGDPKLKYRKEVERRIHQGPFSIPARRLLKQLRDQLGLSSGEADAIEAEVLQPYREHQRKLKEYEDTLAEALQDENPLSDRTCKDLKDYQKYLGLSDEDVNEIEEQLTAPKEAEYQKRQEAQIRQRQQAKEEYDKLRLVNLPLICPQCREENLTRNKFCQGCGTSLTDKTCYECDSKVPFSGETCHCCGAFTGTVCLAIISITQESSVQNSISQKLSSSVSDVIYLDYQQRYRLKLQSLQQIPNNLQTLYEISVQVVDCQPFQKSPLKALIEHQDSSASVIPATAQPYLALHEAYYPTLPEVHDAWEQEGEAVVLLEDRSEWQTLSDLPDSEQLSCLQILYWLDEMAKLWEALEPWHCRQSLLEISNLRTDEDQALGLVRLYPEAKEQILTLQDLGQTWQRLFDQSLRTQWSALQTVVRQMCTTEIRTIAQLRLHLQAIAHTEM
jgi:hypothetical protein